MIDSTIVRAHQQAATGRKKGPGQGSGAFPRRSDDQDPSADRSVGTAGGLPRNCGAGQRLHTGHHPAGRAKDRVCPGRLGLRYRRHRRACRNHGCDRGHPAEVQSQTATGVRQGPLQTEKRHRTLLLSTQTLPPLRHSLRKTQAQLPRPRRSRLRMAPSAAICRYCLEGINKAQRRP